MLQMAARTTMAQMVASATQLRGWVTWSSRSSRSGEESRSMATRRKIGDCCCTPCLLGQQAAPPDEEPDPSASREPSADVAYVILEDRLAGINECLPLTRWRPSSMVQSLVLSFRDDVTVAIAPDEQVVLETRRGKITLGDLSEGLLATLQALAAGGATEETLSELVLATDGAPGLAPLYYHLHRYGQLGLLRYTLLATGEPLAIVVPMVGGVRPSLQCIDPASRVRLSRFAYFRRDGDALVLESPRSQARTILPGHKSVALLA